MNIDLAEIREIDRIQNREDKVYHAALYYARQGIPVIPLNPNEKKINSRTVYTSRCSAREAKIKEWFSPRTGRFRGGNIAIGCGDYFGQGGVFAIDVDTKYDKRYGENIWGIDAWEALVEEYGIIEGPVQRTPSGGLHILTAWREHLVPSQNRLALAVDTRGGHPGKISSHIAAWPSIVDGKEYKWESGGSIAPAPQWLVELMGVSWRSKSAATGTGGRGNEDVGEADVEQLVPLARVAEWLELLNPDDLDYNQWLRVGQAIHSQHPGRDALEIWDEWSQRGERYEPGECHKRWGGFNSQGPVRMATLQYYVQEFGDVGKLDPSQGGDETFAKDIIDEYNKQYAVTLVGENAKIIRKEQVPDSIQDRYKLYSIDGFRLYKSNDTILVQDAKGNPKPIKKLDIWLASPNRNSFDGLLMHPAKPKVVKDRYGHRFLNTWAGFAVEPIEGDWSLLKKHIFDNLCGGNESYYDWLMDWMADMVQDPADPKGCAVILGGVEGAGKGTLANALAHIFGIHASIVSNSRHLGSQFNDMIMDSVFLFADEVVYAGNNEVANMIKAMVTEKKNTREAKFGAKEKVDQFLHVMMSTNNEWKIAAGPESRRWFVLQVKNDAANNRAYFAAIMDQLRNGGYEGMLYELLNRTITSNLRYAPVTEELKLQRTMMQVHSIYDSLPAWIAYVVDTGTLGVPDINDEIDSKPDWPQVVDKTALWEAYADWARRYKPKVAVTGTSVFYKRISSLGFSEGSRIKDRNSDKRVRTINVPTYEMLCAFAEKEMAIYAESHRP